MDIREALLKIASEYAAAEKQNFKGHNLAVFIRDEAATTIAENILPNVNESLIVKGSPGAGRWAEVPWIAIFDSIVTGSATEGFYVVYLFAIDDNRIYLSLNQGTTAVTREFKSQAHTVLKDRAQLMRLRLKDYSHRLASTEIQFRSNGGLPGDYAAGHALGIEYRLSNLPPETTLVSDLNDIISAYRKLIFRGGFDAAEEPTDDLGSAGGSIDEQRQYRMHRRIERNSNASKQVKKFHGYVCQACGFDFEKKYGLIGKEFIEAHHLKQLGLLNENEVVKFDIAKDFAVLCANCHRMIHRMSDVSDLSALVNLLVTASGKT